MFRMKNKVLDGSKGKITSHMGTYVVLFLALGAMTFFGVCTPQGPTSGLTGTAAVVDGEKISYSEFRRAYKAQSDRLKSQYADQFDPAVLRVASMVLNQLVRDRILYISALDLGLKASETEVIAYLDTADAFKDDKGAFSDEYFRNYLQYNGYSEATFLEEMRRNLSVQKLRDLVTKSTFVSSKSATFDYKISETKFDVEYLKLAGAGIQVTVSGPELEKFLADEANKEKVKTWYNSHKSDFSKPEKVHARHILVSYKDARNASGEGAKRDKAAAKARAEKIRAQVNANGTNFVEIAKKETDEPSGQKSGGDLGFFTREMMVKEFSDVAFKLKAGELSQVVESPFGFHVIKAIAKQDKKETSLEAATKDIARKLIKKDRAPKLAVERAEEVLKLLTEKKPVDAKLAEYKLEWKKTGKFAANARQIPGLGSAAAIKSDILKLTKAEPLVKSVKEISGTQYIIRLVEKSEADMAKLDEDRLKQLTGSSAFSQGYSFYSSLEKTTRKKYEDRKAISMNSSFLALDKPQTDQGG